MKYRAGLEGQLIIGNVRRSERAGDAYVVQRLLQRLLRQRIHQIEIEIIEFRRAQFINRAMRVFGRVNAAQPLESGRIKRLRAQGYAVDSRFGVA